MQTWMIIVLVSIVVLGVAGWMLYNRSRSKRLQERFGPAYDQTVSEMGSRRKAEAELQWRELHARQVRARAMDPSERERFTSRWKQIQALFVDDPAGALDEADGLLVEIMRSRGYTADNLYERTTNIAAAYPEQIQKYRHASETLERHRRSPVSTDILRTAFLNYRDLFTDLIGDYDEKLKRTA